MLLSFNNFLQQHSVSPHTFYLTLLCATIIVAVHWVVPILKKLDKVNIAVLNSIAGGLGLAAIIVHLIPDMVSAVPRLAQSTAINLLTKQNTFFFLLFLTVLAGFCAMYIIEKIACDTRQKGNDPENYIYISHLIIASLTLFTMIGTFPAITSASTYGLYLITVLLIAEIIMEDHAFFKHFGERYNWLGRVLIMSAIIGGWAFGVFVYGEEPTITTLFIYAFAIGGILMSVIKTEFDLLLQQSHFPTFLISILCKIIITFILLCFENKYIVVGIN